MRTPVVVWASLLLFPLVPVVLLYLLFSELNYFELTNTPRGLVATGPIAAYVAVVAFGSRLFDQVASVTPLSVGSLRKLRGTWDIASKSDNDSTRRGTCQILYRYGILEISGTFYEDGEVVGAWNSEMTRVVENRLHMVYMLTERKNGREELSRGVSTLTFDSSKVSPMTGQWSLVGRESRLGAVIFTKT